MMTTKNLMIAAAAAVMTMAPLVGMAEAKRGDYRGGYESAEPSRHSGYRKVARTRGHVFTPRINQRIENQERRIRRGRMTGRLTRFETFRLRSRLAAIRSARRLAGIDGHVSRWERDQLISMLDKNSRRIRHLARNGRGSFDRR